MATTNKKRTVRPEVTLSLTRTNDVKWGYVVLVIFLMLITAGAVRFIDKIHYNNVINQLSSQSADYHSQAINAQKDVGFIITQDNSSINCYQLQDQQDRSTCSAHNH
jgi:hypothetical protein